MCTTFSECKSVRSIFAVKHTASHAACALSGSKCIPAPPLAPVNVLGGATSSTSRICSSQILPAPYCARHGKSRITSLSPRTTGGVHSVQRVTYVLAAHRLREHSSDRHPPSTALTFGPPRWARRIASTGTSASTGPPSSQMRPSGTSLISNPASRISLSLLDRLFG